MIMNDEKKEVVGDLQEMARRLQNDLEKQFRYQTGGVRHASQ
jgi:hypothetical protein